MPRILFTRYIRSAIPARDRSRCRRNRNPKDTPRPLSPAGGGFEAIRLIWGSTCETPEGFALSFGGQDQDNDDGIGHTRIKEKGGEWKDIHKELRKANPLQPLHDKGVELRRTAEGIGGPSPRSLFRGRSEQEDNDRIAGSNWLRTSVEKLSRAFEDSFRRNVGKPSSEGARRSTFKRQFRDAHEGCDLASMQMSA